MAGIDNPNVPIDVCRATPELMLLRARREYLEAGFYEDWATVGLWRSGIGAGILDGPEFGGRPSAPVQHQRPARPDIPSATLFRNLHSQNVYIRQAGLVERQARERQLEDRYHDVVHAGQQRREFFFDSPWTRPRDNDEAEFLGSPPSFTPREASAGHNSDLDNMAYLSRFTQGEATAGRDHEVNLSDLSYPATWGADGVVSGRAHVRRPRPPTQGATQWPTQPRMRSPDYHAMLTCQHTNVMSAGTALCHGCLQRRAGRQMCRACLASFCAPCLISSRARSLEDNID